MQHDNESSTPRAKRFWRHVSQDGPVPEHRPEVGHCWTWTGTIDKTGYGRIQTIGAPSVAAHRVSYEIAYGPIPEGLWVLHECDNRSCVRPAHLYAGDRRANIDDMLRRRRQPFGARNGLTSLTDAKVLEILASEFHISEQSVCDICKRRSWTHI